MFCKDCLIEMYEKITLPEKYVLGKLYDQINTFSKMTQTSQIKDLTKVPDDYKMVGLSQEKLTSLPEDSSLTRNDILKAIYLLEGKAMIDKISFGKSKVLRLTDNGVSMVEVMISKENIKE